MPPAALVAPHADADGSWSFPTPGAWIAHHCPGVDPDAVDAFIDARVAFKADRLAAKFGLPAADRQDGRQELLLGLTRALRQFDPARAHWKTFVSCVLDYDYCHLVRRQMAAARHGAKRPVALEQLDPAGRELVCERQLDRAVAYTPGDLQRDVEGVLARLPERQRRICRLMKVHSLSETARILGVSKTTVHRALERARRPFRQAGLVDRE